MQKRTKDSFRTCCVSHSPEERCPKPFTWFCSQSFGSSLEIPTSASVRNGCLAHCVLPNMQTPTGAFTPVTILEVTQKCFSCCSVLGKCRKTSQAEEGHSKCIGFAPQPFLCTHGSAVPPAIRLEFHVPSAAPLKNLKHPAKLKWWKPQIASGLQMIPGTDLLAGKGDGKRCLFFLRNQSLCPARYHKHTHLKAAFVSAPARAAAWDQKGSTTSPWP